VDNILGITNAAAVPAEGLGGSYAHRYTYDDLNRLISASGTAEARGEEHRYSLGMEYDDRYNILAKRQAHILNGDTVAATSCSLRYAYEGERPNQATSVGSREVYYDADGNLTLWQDTTTGAYRQMVWDEEDRLVAVSSNGDSYAYTYDASGERVIKSHTDNSSVFVNGKFMGSIQHGSDFTVYVSPMMTYTGERFTKHYYAGSERVASRMGTGSFANKFSAANPVLTAGNQNYVSRMAALNAAEVENPASSLALPPGPATNKGVYARMAAEGKIEAVKTAADSAMGDAASYDIPRGWPRTPVFNPQGDAPGAPIKFRELTPDSVHAGYTFVQGSSMVELDQYFYHGDHISSTVCVTDRLGRIVQSLVYLPFGETMLDEASISPAMPYKFSGKEQDTETGMSYFGARYYDPMMAMWMGPDPLAAKYPQVSPYVFCMNNPVLFLDPDGREVIISGTLRYTTNTDNKLRGDAKRMAGMIDNNSITVNLNTTEKNETSTGNLMIGGAFMGNTVTKDADGNTKVVANQEVNPNVLGSADAHTNTPGKMIMHEATEAYAGAQISQKEGTGVGVATQADVANPTSVYNRAHNKATSQTPVYQTLYDKSGNVTTDVTQAVRVEWSVTNNGSSKVIQTYP
jgi:RHS repeat-associated protein